MLKIKVPAKLESLSEVNAFISNALPDDFKCIQTQVELAAEELLVNVFSYAYKDTAEKEGEVELSCRMIVFNDVPCFYFAVLDWGKPFNPFLETQTPDISLDVDDRPIGGLGIFLIKSVVAHYEYSYVNKSNHIELYFARPKS